MNQNETKGMVEALSRIGRILACVYTWQLGDMEQGQKAEHLSRCGFSNAEIAGLLGMTANAVNVALHRARRSKRQTIARTKTKSVSRKTASEQFEG